MQFLMTIAIGQPSSAPPPAFQTAMTNLIDDETRAGTIVSSGGLAPSALGGRLTLAKGELTVGEPIGGHMMIDGYAVLEASSMEEAFKTAARVMQLHQVYVANWAVECAVRPIVTHCVP
jgi:hypothetical protein